MVSDKTVNSDPTKKTQKKDVQPPKDPTMKTAWIRVTKVNKTGDDKSNVVMFTKEQIKDILDEWSWTAHITYWFIDHVPDDDDPNEHYHIAIKFNPTSRFSTIKNKFPFGYIEPAKNLKRAVQYLVHLNHPEKLSYSWDDIVTNCGDMTPYRVLSRSQQDIHLQRIFESIDNGEITMLNYENYIPIELYAKHSTQINNAFKYKIDKIVSNNNRQIKVIYMYGKSGIGKTRLAKDYSKALYPDEEPCITSSSNDPLQDYKGQKTIIWDDFRDSQFRFADLLKFLDPFTRSSGKSRYINKHFIGDLIILTSTQRMDFLYKGCVDQSEDMKQLRRRISEYHEFVGDRVRIFIYDKETDKFVFYKEYENPYTSTNQLCAADAGFDITPYEKLGLKLYDPVVQPIVYNGIPEATEEEKRKRAEYEASLPSINWGNVNKCRVG